MRYESEAGLCIDDPSPEEVDDYLGRLDGIDESYASLTDESGSYLQVGGGPDEFTIEVREVRPDGSFRHLKATRHEPDSAGRFLTIGGANVAVRADQVLDSSLVRRLVRTFALGRGADPAVSWDDMTAMFLEGS